MNAVQRFVVAMIIAISAHVGFLVSIGAASAQDMKYPSRVVYILVPFTAGTNADIIARLYATELSERLRQTFVVKNLPGAGGILAAEAVLNAPADGYTLMFVSSGHAVNPSLHKTLPYDTSRDFSGIALVGYSPTLLVVNPSLNIHTQQEFIALAKRQPGKLNYGSAGVGSATQFACAYFRREAGIDIVHVPFTGVLEFISEILGGRIDLGCPPIALALSQIRDGKLIALSVTSRDRTSLLPEVPTTSEAGLSGFEYGIWYGLVASSKTPTMIIGQLAKEVAAITKRENISEKMTNLGVAPRDLTGSDFDAFIKVEIEKTRDLARASGIEAN